MSAINSEQPITRRTNIRQNAAKNTEPHKAKRKGNGLGRNSAQPKLNVSTHSHEKANNDRSGNGINGKGTRQNARANQQRQAKEQKIQNAQPPAGISEKATVKTQDQSRLSPYSDIANTGTSDHFLAHISRPAPAQKLKNAGPLQEYTQQDVIKAGPVFPDPSIYGFMRPQQKAKPRPIPRYMFPQPRLLAAPLYEETKWDTENQQKMVSMEEANAGVDLQGLYDEFQKMRDVERQKMEELGLVDAEYSAKDLHDAIFFQGTCRDMCPTFERVRRSLESNVTSWEKDPFTSKISRARAVKAFSRPAAGQPPPIPSDVRPPHVLLQTLDYLESEILPRLPESHSFIWDRTRSIRQDFVYQNYYGPEAIECTERIVRIHLLSLHVMAGSNIEYSQQQELEQFNKALQTLTEIYLDVRRHGGRCANEAEFRAYHLLSHFRNPELELEVQTFPNTIFHSRMVQLALRFRMVMSQNNVVERGYTNTIGAVNLFVEFFRLVFDQNTPLLLAFLLETHFNEIRFYALKSLSRCYHTKGKAFSAESLRQMLGFATLLEVTEFVTYYDIDTLEENGELLVDLCNKDKLESRYKLTLVHDKPKRAPAYSPQLDYRMRNRSFQSLVNCGLSNADLGINPVKPAESLHDMLDDVVLEPIKLRLAGSSLEVNTPFAGGNTTRVHENFGGSDNGTLLRNKPGFGLPQKLAASQPAQGGSFRRSDFLNNKKATTSLAQTATPAFDFTANTKAPADPVFSNEKVNQKPLFPSFGGKTKADFKLEIAQKPPPVTSKKGHVFGALTDNSVLNFAGANKKSYDDNSLKKEKRQKPKESVKNDAFENKNVLSSSNQKGLNPLPSVLPAFKPPEPETTQLIQSTFVSKHKPHQKFEKALDLTSKDLLRMTVDSEVRNIALQFVKHQNSAVERRRLIDALADELYTAFLAEQTHQTMRETVAQVHYAKCLARRVFGKVHAICRKSFLKKEQRQQRQSEVQQVSFKAPSLKKRGFGALSEPSFTKKPRFLSNNTSALNVSLENIHERQEEIQRLWRPINLMRFLGSCPENTRAKLENGTVDLSCIVIAENWNSPYSKWLSTKFSLKVSEDKTHYINEVQSNGINIVFRSLPKTDFVNEQAFRSTPFIVFECGFVDETQVSLYENMETKLTRDGHILAKIVQLCARFCYYKVQVLLVVWDISNCHLSEENMKELFQVDTLMSVHRCVQGIEICSMASHSGDVSETLEALVFQMGHGFSGQLSKRGIHKRAGTSLRSEKAASMTETLEKPILAEPEATSSDDLGHTRESLTAKETAILTRAKKLQKRKYLSAHAASSASFLTTAVASRNNLANLSNAAFRMPNGSCANHTLVNDNHSCLGNNANIHTRMHASLSFMRSFANTSVIEESTPMASPGPAPANSHNLSLPQKEDVSERPQHQHTLPNKVQELRDITASVKARYTS